MLFILDESTTCFYIACIILALEHIHGHAIIYRDLKPENIMLSSDGYILLTDFGCAKKLHRCRTYTYCGTEEYMAPEIITNVGQTLALDWWCLGILVYEMLVGSSPFFDPLDSIHIFDRILDLNYVLPVDFPPTARDMVVALLVIDATNRPLSLLSNPFFCDIDWVALESKRLPVPIPIILANPLDLHYFL